MITEILISNFKDVHKLEFIFDAKPISISLTEEELESLIQVLIEHKKDEKAKIIKLFDINLN